MGTRYLPKYKNEKEKTRPNASKSFLINKILQLYDYFMTMCKHALYRREEISIFFQ